MHVFGENILIYVVFSGSSIFDNSGLQARKVWMVDKMRQRAILTGKLANQSKLEHSMTLQESLRSQGNLLHRQHLILKSNICFLREKT